MLEDSIEVRTEAAWHKWWFYFHQRSWIRHKSHMSLESSQKKRDKLLKIEDKMERHYEAWMRYDRRRNG